MKITIEVDVERVDGLPLPAPTIGEHLCANHIRPGELPAQPGQIWVGESHYRILAARTVASA